jgi:hypothetical protein
MTIRKSKESIEAIEAPMDKKEKNALVEKLNAKAREIALKEQGESAMTKGQQKETADKINEAAKSQDGAAAEPSDEQKQRINIGMHTNLQVIENVILGSRKFRSKIDRIMKIIELSGLQTEIATQTKTFNPIEHSLKDFTLAKGSLGELLKRMTPQIDLIGLKCYNNYLDICHDLGEKPTYGDMIYPFLPKEYMDGLLSAVNDALVNNVDPVANHENWMKDRLADGWKLGKVKDAEKKTHPSLISYDQLPEGERRKNEELIRIVNEFKNPYVYPKQVGSDVEDVVDSVVVEDLNIVLPEGKYKNHANIDVEHASQLNRVQMVDWIKGMISDLIDEYIEFKFNSILKSKVNLYNPYSNDVDVLLLAVIHVQSVYTNLINAKNIFGYTFQYFK